MFKYFVYKVIEHCLHFTSFFLTKSTSYIKNVDLLSGNLTYLILTSSYLTYLSDFVLLVRFVFSYIFNHVSCHAKSEHCCVIIVRSRMYLVLKDTVTENF